MNQKGQALIAGIAIGLLIIIGLFVTSYLRILKGSKVQIQDTSNSSQSASPTINPSSTLKFTDQNQTSGIMGTATLGPTCPGPQRAGQVCTKPYQGEIKVQNQDKTQTITTFTTNTDGSFKVSLPPGSYYLVQSTSGSLPFLKEAAVKVEVNVYTKVDSNFDTGIR